MAALAPFPPKAPEDVLWLPFSFAAQLAPCEAIVAAAAAAAPSDVAIEDVDTGTPTTLVAVSGGTAGVRYTLSCAVRTSQGRSLIASAILLVGEPGLDDPLYVQPLPDCLVPVAGLVPPGPPLLAFSNTQLALAIASGAIGTLIFGFAPVPPPPDDPPIILDIRIAADVAASPPPPIP